jgi:outer membrane immunogenic protein
MNRLLLTGLVAAAFASNAFAADLPAKTSPPAFAPPSPAYSWNGCYVGVVGGGNWGSSQHYAADAATDGPLGLLGAAQTGGIGLAGGVVGGTVGCNYQVNNFVFGAEGDYSWTDQHGSANLIAPFKTTDVVETEENSIGTLRGRVGYAWDRLLIYGTGGGAITNEGVSLCDPVNGCVGASKNVVGWAAGVGVEYAFWNNFTLKLEYLHADFGSTDFGRLKPSATFTFNERRVSLTDDMVRIGLNYKFDLFSPVVARY